MKKVIIVAGPTASGKTDLAIKIAQEIGGEIINADSRQIYKHLDIGTNKGNLVATNEFIDLNGKTIEAFDVENSGVLGWLFSFLDPNQDYSVAEFNADALELIDMLIAMDKIPVIVGGTGLYIDALVKGYSLNKIETDTNLREQLNKLSVDELLEKVMDLDPERFLELNQSDQSNPHRLIRAIEIAMGTTDQERNKTLKPLLDTKILYPVFERPALFAKIDQRAAMMVKEGLVAETKKAIELGFANSNPLLGIGYKAAQEFIAGKITEQQLTDLVAQDHRNYAKRQITWFEGTGRAYNLIKVDFKSDIKTILNLLIAK
jgi:tRNA dimethylallyltransferase